MLANNKGTDQAVMMSKSVYLSVEIVTDNPTSGKISIPQLVSVAEQNGLSLTWSQPGRNPSIYVNMLVYQLCMLIDPFPIIGFYLYHVISADQSNNWTTSGM